METGGERGHAAGDVYVVDDDAQVTSIVVRMLRRAGYRVASWNSPEAFLAEAKLECPCCLILDVHMPHLTGPEVQARLARAGVPASIVFISGGADVPTSVGAMKAGAVDFLEKPFDRSQLLAAVATALERSRAAAADRALMDDARARLARLTPRELEVAEYMARGLRSKEIARELGTAVKTVEVHRSRVMSKLGADSLPALVHIVTRARGA